MKEFTISWSIDHDTGDPDKFFLIGDCNNIRFVESTYSGLWSFPLMYNKWLIKRRFKTLIN